MVDVDELILTARVGRDRREAAIWLCPGKPDETVGEVKCFCYLI